MNELQTARLKLQDMLEEIIGSRNVYYRPPSNMKSYPAILYDLNNIDINYSDDAIYSKRPNFQIILIDKNPDSEYVDKILQLPYCSLSRTYVSDNLNHFVFIKY